MGGAVITRRVLLSMAAVVAALVGLLMWGSSGSIRDTGEQLFPDPVARTPARISNLREEVAQHVRARGKLPTAPGDLPSLRGGRPLRDLPRHDAWGSALLLGRTGNGYFIRSLGPDGIVNTPHDLLYQVSGLDTLR